MKKINKLTYSIISLNICYLIIDIFYFFNQRLNESIYIAYEFPLETNIIVFLKWGILILFSFLLYRLMDVYKLWMCFLIGIISVLILTYSLYCNLNDYLYRGSFAHNLLLLEMISILNLVYLFFKKNR